MLGWREELHATGHLTGVIHVSAFFANPTHPRLSGRTCAFYIAMDGKIGTHTLFTLMESIYFPHIVSENLKNSGGPT